MLTSSAPSRKPKEGKILGHILKKPKRPLTAYLIYFQIEREFIIQTLSGEDADKSILEGKIFFKDVPQRYVNTRLSPDWYFGPGKRAKRKHRKQHGKISFLELSRVINSRWTKLEETDPDIKQFVSKLAEQEVDEYNRELKKYRENLIKNMITPVVVSNRSSTIKKQPAPQAQQQSGATITMEYHPTTPETNPVQLDQERDRFKNEFEFDYASTYEQKRSFVWGERRPEDDFVDICNDDILSMWKSLHAE